MRKFRELIWAGWRLTGILVFWLIAIELASFGLVRHLDAKDARRQESFWNQSDSYAGADWIDAYMADFFRIRLRWEPYVYWRRLPFQSRFINVDDAGLRRTSAGLPAGPGAAAIRIHVYGGSTTWGEGVRDEATIPSLISQGLVERGLAAEVVNLGEGGYVFTQELIALLRRLQRGDVPDVAIFYNGLNDRYSAAQSGEPGIPQNEWNRRAEFNLSARQIQVWRLAVFGPNTGLYMFRLLHRLRHAPEAGQSAPLDAELARGVRDVYWTNVRTIQALGQAYGFVPLFYWQPVLYDKPQRTPFEERLKATQPAAFEPFFAAVRNGLKTDAEGQEMEGFHDIGGLFETVSDPLFIDFSHISEEGNRRVAHRILEDLRPVVERMGTNHEQSPN